MVPILYIGEVLANAIERFFFVKKGAADLLNFLIYVCCQLETMAPTWKKHCTTKSHLEANGEGLLLHAQGPICLPR